SLLITRRRPTSTLFPYTTLFRSRRYRPVPTGRETVLRIFWSPNMSTALQPVHNLSPGANLEAYVQTVSSIPVLSIEEERELADRLYYQEDLDAARQLVMSHLRFVVHIARSYAGYGLAQADLIQEGNVGLMK